MHGLAQRMPLLIDEADGTLDAFPQARRSAMRGVSSKSCKGLYKSILNRARCDQWNAQAGGEPRYFMSAEDLTCQAGLAVQQDLALVALLGLTHCERNGHHYVDGLAARRRPSSRPSPLAHPRPLRRATARRACASATGGSTRRSLNRASPARPDLDWRRRRGLSPDYFQGDTAMAHTTTRHHHARRHRPHGHEPAPDPLDRRDPRAGRRDAVERRPVMPDPILVGRNGDKIEALAQAHGIERWGTDLDAALANPDDTVFFDAGTTQMRADAARQGDQRRQARLLREADRHQPATRRVELARLAQGCRHQARRGAGQAVPARPAQARACCVDAGFFGRMLSVRGEFGYWVFEGDLQPTQRPSWNYRKEDGGGIILDMLCHWRYVLDNLFGEVKCVSCLGATHIPERVDESGKPYQATADDAAYATFELGGRRHRADQHAPGARACGATTS